MLCMNTTSGIKLLKIMSSTFAFHSFPCWHCEKKVRRKKNSLFYQMSVEKNAISFFLPTSDVMCTGGYYVERKHDNDV